MILKKTADTRYQNIYEACCVCCCTCLFIIIIIICIELSMEMVNSRFGPRNPWIIVQHVGTQESYIFAAMYRKQNSLLSV